MQTNKKNKHILGIIQSFLILILVVLIIFMMIQISRLQGTARVINYAGLVRGATQREVKLEITGNQNDELIKYLDDILLTLEIRRRGALFFVRIGGAARTGRTLFNINKVGLHNNIN